MSMYCMSEIVGSKSDVRAEDTIESQEQGNKTEMQLECALSSKWGGGLQVIQTPRRST